MLGKRLTHFFLQGLLSIDCFPTMKHLSTNCAIPCMLCEAVRRSVGSTVYTWERPNNHSTGTWHTIGEPACWEKSRLYTCISGKKTMTKQIITFLTDRTQNHHDLDGRTYTTTLPTRGTMCHGDVDTLAGLFCKHFQLIWLSTWRTSRKFWQQNFRNINIFMTHNAFLTTKIYGLHCTLSLTCWYILFTFARRWTSGGDGQSLGQCTSFRTVCVHWCEINGCRPLTKASNQLADIRKHHKCFFSSVAHSGLTSTSTASRLRVTDPPRCK